MPEKPDIPAGTIKGPGRFPHEFVFVTRDSDRARVGEFVYYEASVAGRPRQIVGTITSRALVRSLPDSFLVDPATAPSSVSSLIGLGDGAEIFEITVETIGYFSSELGDFVNPRIPPRSGDPVRLASSETLAGMLSPRKMGERGSAHLGSLLTRDAGEVPVVVSVKDVVSTHLAVLA
jgi:DNA helicase HerA-like ATPase